mgnify:FL=1
MIRRPIAHLAIATAAMGALATSCGGSSTPLSQEEFCAKVVDIQGSENNFSPEAIAIVSELADRAPTAELRNAFGVLLPAWKKLATIDTNDSEAFASLLAEFDTKAIDDAGQVLDDYVTNVCGVTDTTSSADDGDADGDTSSDDDGDANSSTDPYDQIDFTELIDTIDGLLPLYGGVTATTGTSMSGLFPGAEIIIPFDVEGDGLALCNGVLDWVSTQTSDPNVVIRIQVKGSDTVTRLAGADCAKA